MGQIVRGATHSLATPRAKKLFRRAIRISNLVRRMFISGSSGSGKTQLMGKGLIWGDFRNQVPLIVFDPHGPLIDTFLAKITRQPGELQRQLWPRIRYVDMSGKGSSIIPLPLYYRLGDESWAEIAARPVEVFIKTDPDLATASIMGKNALEKAGVQLGMLLAAMGMQVSEAPLLFDTPGAWETKINQALGQHPELLYPVNFYQGLLENKSDFRQDTVSFFNKIYQRILDPNLKALYCAPKMGLDWREVIQKRQAVLFDFRHCSDMHRHFALRWTLNFVQGIVRERGAGRHDPPLSVFIDELAALFPMVGTAADQLIVDLDALINQYARNYSMWLCVSTQELFQFTDRGLAKTLLGMPTQIHGVTSDDDAAEVLARRFFNFDEFWVRHWVSQWMQNIFGEPIEIDRIPMFFTPEEQIAIHAREFKQQPTFTFKARLPQQEGSLFGPLITFSTANLDRGLYPNASLVAEARERLARRDGRLVGQLLEEIQARAPGTALSAPGTEPQQLLQEALDQEPEVPLWIPT